VRQGRLAPIEAALAHRALPPREASEGAPSALLILHGRGADELDLLGLAPELDPRFLVISARAPFQLGFGYHWYELLAVGRPEPRTFARGLAMLERFVEEIVEGYGLDPARLYLLGFSQGAMMAGSLTLSRPERVAGTVMLSGYLPVEGGAPAEEGALRGKPFFVAHGGADPVIPVEYGRFTRDYLARLGAELEYHEYPMEHSISPEELQAVARWLRGALDGSARGSEPRGASR
jgi:phospholipase/carboxylesterase